MRKTNEKLSMIFMRVHFLLPSIIGVSVYRDYKSEMHTILYSYPFTKANYLFAKFFSSVFIVTIIVFTIGLGMFIGFRLPGINQEIVGAFRIMSYLEAYLVYIIPNTLFFGAIVFAVVTFTRNIAAGFITVIILMFIQGLTESLFYDPENRFLAAILDPFGSAASNYYTRYWTLAEQNELYIPIKEVIIYNRLLWLSITTAVFGLVYKFFAFSQDALSFSFIKQRGERTTKSNFGRIKRIKLPKVEYNFSLLQNLKTTWKLSNTDFKYIVKSLPFISIVFVGLILILIVLSEVGNIFGTKTLPTTWKMLNGGVVFTLSINICTFLYAGMLVHRAKIYRVNQLIDTTPVPNWSLMLSKLIAILKMQIVLLSVIMVSGILFQLYKGYYNFEIWHYVYELYVLNFIHFVIWALLTLFIQTLIGNPYLGLFIMLVISIGIPLLPLAGIEEEEYIFKYNKDPGFSYSDMNGYGNSLLKYFIYKIYWLSFGLIFLITTTLFWVRGLPHSFKERLFIAKSRFRGLNLIAFVVFSIAFLGLRSIIYKGTHASLRSVDKFQLTWGNNPEKFENYAQPRIVSVKIDMNIFPKELNFDASGTYLMINKSDEEIDSIFLYHNSYSRTFEFDKPNILVLEDSITNWGIYQLKKPLQPGDSLSLNFTLKNKPNTIFRGYSLVKSNGTFIDNRIFPSLGFTPFGYMSRNDLRPHPSDSTALANTYISKDADWIDFETTVSTSEDQIAIAPGYLQKEWTKDGRRYFHYKMDTKILNFYAFNSARYEIKKDKWNDVKLEIYYHKKHKYNLDRMIKGMKASLEYNSKNFSPYQHKQLRIVEFPRGGFAQSFPNTIPYAEDLGFIADVDDTEEGGVDYPFTITVHEVAHQWWLHQVIGADVLGATMLSESLSEYVSLKVLEHQYGKSKMRKFLKKALDDYLLLRTMERKRESALMYNDGQRYIRYQKGSLVFYALSDYIGEEKLNGALRKYVEKVKFQEAPYTTSIDMVNHIKEVVPDSLQYIIKDMFETITLYRNKIVEAKYTELENGKFQVDIEFNVSKYRNDEKGKRYYGEQTGDTMNPHKNH